MEAFVGRWRVRDTENLDEILRVLRVEGDMAKYMREHPPDLEYIKDGQQWTMRVINANGTRDEHTFVDGQTLDTTGTDGSPVKLLIQIEDNKFIEHYKSENSAESTVTREILNQELVVTIESQGVTSIARHERV